MTKKDPAVNPPSMGKVMPVIQDASAEQKKSAAGTTSCHLADPPEGIHAGEIVEDLRFLFDSRIPDWCADRARRDAIDPYPVWTIVDRHILGQIDHSGFGRAIGRFPQSHQTVDRANIQNDT